MESKLFVQRRPFSRLAALTRWHDLALCRSVSQFFSPRERETGKQILNRLT